MGWLKPANDDNMLQRVVNSYIGQVVASGPLLFNVCFLKQSLALFFVCWTNPLRLFSLGQTTMTMTTHTVT
ncbi:hypothetical protein BDW42DRAFT_162894 [Aspergillus taichungensis]|uniref:Uncharacterized protein n=1 Tax=Aspergillus taichungensis TaxID=482145 RepID=A0A2J5I3A0_9EURO|nr:hypothetical protein BDW42DRAFT_162894 [Aspergillus taichungensis]